METKNITMTIIKGHRHDSYKQQLNSIIDSLLQTLFTSDGKLNIDSNKYNKIEVKMPTKNTRLKHYEKQLVNYIHNIIEYAHTNNINIRYKN